MDIVTSVLAAAVTVDCSTEMCEDLTTTVPRVSSEVCIFIPNWKCAQSELTRSLVKLRNILK